MVHYFLVKELPKGLTELAPIAKFIWLWVKYNGKGEYSVRLVMEALGLSKESAHRAWRDLLKTGWIVEYRSPAGPVPGEYGVSMQPFHPLTPLLERTE